ncbi:MAG: hypothetical protein WDW38_001938 [Sanguina aurantia]
MLRNTTLPRSAACTSRTATSSVSSPVPAPHPLFLLPPPPPFPLPPPRAPPFLSSPSVSNRPHTSHPNSDISILAIASLAQKPAIPPAAASPGLCETRGLGGRPLPPPRNGTGEMPARARAAPCQSLARRASTDHTAAAAAWWS